MLVIYNNKVNYYNGSFITNFKPLGLANDQVGKSCIEVINKNIYYIFEDLKDQFSTNAYLFK